MLFSEEEKMGPFVGETELSEALVSAGENLLKPHSSTKALLHLLNEAEAQLSKLVQDPNVTVQKALRPLMNALVSAHLLRNPDSDVRVYVVSCLTEIMRITAPEAPYDDDQMKEIFQVTVKAFGKLGDTSSPNYKKVVAVLDTVSRVRLSLVMLDLECDDLILKMFRHFLKTIRPNHPESVLLSMEAIMVTVIHGSEEVPMDLLEILLAAVNKENQDVSPMASWLVEKVLISCACRLQPCIMEALKSTRTSLDMFSPVVLAICQGEAETYIVVKPKQVEGQMGFRLSHKGTMSKRIARCGTRAHGDEKVRDKNDLKQVKSESIEAETESGSTRRGGEKISSLMSPEEGCSFMTSSSKKVQEKELGKMSAKKPSLPSKVGQTNQSVVSSLSLFSNAREGSRKRSRSKIEGCLPTPPSKKQTVKKENPEEDFMESDLKKLEDSIKTTKSSKKERSQNGLKKTSAEKPLAKFKMERAHDGLAKTSAKKALAESKSGKREAGGEVKSPKSELCEELVGKRMKVWWPLDNKFYEGVINSYCSSTKRHEVSYTDGDVENLDLSKERWEIIQDNYSSNEEEETDLPDSTLLSDIRRMQKAKKRKNVSKNVELRSSSDVRSSKKKVPLTNSTKLKSVRNEQARREERNLKSSKPPKAETGRTKGRAEKRQRVTRSMHREIEKDCDDKEEPETKGEDSLKFEKESNAQPECKRDHQELPDDSNSEPKGGGEVLKSANEPAVKADGEERHADTKLIEEEDVSEESHRDAYTSMLETGKVENEDDQRVVKELEEETDKADVGSIRVSF